MKTIKSAEVQQDSIFYHGVVILPDSGPIKAALRNLGCLARFLFDSCFAIISKQLTASQSRRMITELWCLRDRGTIFKFVS